MEEKSFEELYNESLNNKRFDKTVTGKVIDISSKGEIFVDFGYKADGIIPFNEFSEDGTDLRKLFKAGDEISADVLKWNDGTGNVLLSYKKMLKRENAIKEKEERIKRAEERQIQKAEYEKQKKERQQSILEFWDNIKVGQKFNGIIVKIESYGIFVDLELAKGLLHISEVTWNKEEDLNNLFTVGEEIEVVVKSVNKEDKKIGLSYPLKPENPWHTLIEKYKVNDIVTCKVIKFASFGAFVEIEKGLEGLIHNSQITSIKRITKPEEVLKLDQILNAKIINIDKENCKIGLSIKDLEGTSMEYGYEGYIKGENK